VLLLQFYDASLHIAPWTRAKMNCRRCTQDKFDPDSPHYTDAPFKCVMQAENLDP